MNIQRIWYKTYTFIPDLFREIRYGFQRAHRGYSDRDCWAIDEFLADILPKMIRQLSKYHGGCPIGVYDKKKKGNECHQWEKILIEMAEGFEAARSLNDLDFYEKGKAGWEKRRKKLFDKFNKGMALFVKYYFGLWD